MSVTTTASVLVIDVDASTELRARLGEEAADVVQRSLDARLREAVAAAHGTVVKALGDGLLAIFESAADALTAALSIQRDGAAASPEQAFVPVSLRVGVSAGDVSVENGGVFGVPIVEAARLAGVCEPGQVLVADIVRSLTRGRGGHSFQSVGELTLEGIPTPVAACRVAWERVPVASPALAVQETALPRPFDETDEDPARLAELEARRSDEEIAVHLNPGSVRSIAWADPHRSSRPSSGPFVGREKEMAIVRAWLHEAQAGEPRIVLLGGEAGIGKSAFLTRVLASAQAGGWLVLRASCLQGARIGYLPLFDALTPLRERRYLSPLDAETLADFLFDYAGAPDGTDSDISADRSRLGMFMAITRTLMEVAEQEPIILAIEDVQWADGSTLGYLEYLAAMANQKSTAAPVPLVLIVTSRRTPEADPASRSIQRLKREVTYRELQLRGLDHLEINRLVTEVGNARPASRFLRSMAEATQGNPLLLRSLLDRLIAEGAVAVHDGLLAGQNLQLPDAALDLDVELESRLERASGDCHELLAWAAILGDGQPVAALQAVTGYSHEPFDHAMDLAARAQLLYEDGDNYRFDHPQLREVLYGKIPARQRRRRHRAAAERLQDLWGASGGQAAPAVAHHLYLAGADAPAAALARSARIAAEQSFTMAGWSDAAFYFDMCIAAAPDADVDLLWLAGLAHFRNHDHPEAQDRLSRAAELARSIGDERLWGLAVLTLTRSRLISGPSLGADTDLQPLQDFILDSHHDTTDLRARAYAVLADAHFANFDTHLGLEQAQLALRTASSINDHEVIVEVEQALGIQYLAALQLDDAEAHLLNCQESAHRLTERWGTSWGASRLPLLRWCQGDLTEADRLASQAATRAEHLDWADASLVNACRVAVAVAQGRLSAAEDLAVVAYQQYLRADYPWALLVLAPALIASRSFQGDGSGVQSAIAMLEQVGTDPQWFNLAARAILGDLDAASADLPGQPVQSKPPYNLFDVAYAALQAEVCDVTGDRILAQAALGPLEAAHAAGLAYPLGWVACLPRLLGVVHRCLNPYGEAETWLRSAMTTAREASTLTELARIQLNLAELLMARGERQAASLAAKEAARMFRQVGLFALLQRCDRYRLAVADPPSDS
jgi:class 3 adenylate cyclase/tetratricopeptide (TPR) repeat protein